MTGPVNRKGEGRSKATVWRDSEEFRELFNPERRFSANSTYIMAYAATLLLVAVFVTSYKSTLLVESESTYPDGRRVSQLPSSIEVPLTLFQVFGFGIGAILLLYVGARYGTARLAFLDRVRHEKSLAVEEALATASQSMRIGDLFTLNRRQLDEYHVLSVRQQKQAFRAAQAASLIAFSILVAGALIALSQESTGKQIIGGSLAALGTALSAFVAKVFFQSYNSSSDLLKDYYEEPFRTSRVLTLQRIVETGHFGSSERSQAWAKLAETLNDDFVRNGDLRSPDGKGSSQTGSEAGPAGGKGSRHSAGKQPSE